MKAITHTSITPAGYPYNDGDYNATVVPGESINIYGVQKNHVNGPQPFGKMFRTGDPCVYDSWNLKYVGTIIAIGPKTVSVQHGFKRQPEVSRLHLYKFCRHNWNFDAAAVAAYNAEEMQCL